MPLQLRHAYAAGFPRSLHADDINQLRSFPSPRVMGARCNPAHIRQVRAGGVVLRGVRPLVHFRYTFPSRLPDPFHLTVLEHSGVVRAASTLPRVSGIGLPSASPACCDRLAAVSFHHRTISKRLVALDVPGPHLVRSARLQYWDGVQATTLMATPATLEQ